eukprot:TRINITY_DN423_c0_g2_i12.p1 TRINITY_DN423_c0_g2~~TRINITY_DN423_c0_g2_i12.p1  ORF type:complete len:408 (+),score=119.48 TRINITY_DN423_c0_g2_i12:192-1415(+)
MQNDGEWLIQSILARSKGCSEIWNRIKVHKGDNDDDNFFETLCLTDLELRVVENDHTNNNNNNNNNNINKLVFGFGTQLTPFSSLRPHFQQVLDAKANKGNCELPDNDYNITEEMLELYQDLNPARPGVLQTLQVWQRALEDCFVYLGKTETTLLDLQALEKEVMRCFNITQREDHHVSEVTFIRKVPEMGVTVTKKSVSLENMEEIRKIAEVVSMCYELGEVTYVSKNVAIEKAAAEKAAALRRATQNGANTSVKTGSIANADFEKTVAERVAAEKASLEKANAERVASLEKALAEKAASEKANAERVASLEKAFAERTAEKIAMEKVLAEHVERALAEELKRRANLRVCKSEEQVKEEIRKNNHFLLAPEITTLKLYNNNIGDSGAECIASSLKENKTLTLLLHH